MKEFNVVAETLNYVHLVDGIQLPTLSYNTSLSFGHCIHEAQGNDITQKQYINISIEAYFDYIYIIPYNAASSNIDYNN